MIFLFLYVAVNTFVVVAGQPKILRVEKFIKKKEYNIATPQWLVRALGSESPLTELIKFTPSDMIFATEKLQQHFNDELDMAEDVYECDTPEIIFNEPTDVIDDIKQCAIWCK